MVTQGKKMGSKERGQLIDKIIGKMRLDAGLLKKPYDGASLFFSLAFMPDDELKNIARLCGIKHD